jgi:hypothetical protein
MSSSARSLPGAVSAMARCKSLEERVAHGQAKCPIQDLCWCFSDEEPVSTATGLVPAMSLLGFRFPAAKGSGVGSFA